jgi:hypothetical protein
VDKTAYIYHLLNEEKASFFLSRPRRFGKTLFLSTLNELFTGNRERFKGLWIERSDYLFAEHPVIFLSFSQQSHNQDDLKNGLMTDLKQIAKKFNVTVDASLPASYFGALIQAIYNKTNSKVAVLIDEYDAREKLSPDVIGKILRGFIRRTRPASLKRPNQKGLPGFGQKQGQGDYLGLAIYGDGSRIEALFD